MKFKTIQTAKIDAGLTYDKDQPEYGYYIDSDGVRQFGQTGMKDVYSFIQKDLKQTDFEYIMSLVKRGDTSVLMARDGFFDDVSESPDSLLDALSLGDELRDRFNELPLEVRSKYGNSIYNFARAVSAGDYSAFDQSPVSEQSGQDSKTTAASLSPDSVFVDATGRKYRLVPDGADQGRESDSQGASAGGDKE